MPGEIRRINLLGWDATTWAIHVVRPDDSARGLDMPSTLGASVFAGLSEGFPMTSFGDMLALISAFLWVEIL